MAGPVIVCVREASEIPALTIIRDGLRNCSFVMACDSRPLIVRLHACMH